MLRPYVISKFEPDNCQTAKRHRPCSSCRPRVGPRPLSFFLPHNVRGWSAGRRLGTGAPVAESPPPGTRFRGVPAPGLTDPERRLPALHAAIAVVNHDRRRAALFVRDFAGVCTPAARPSASSWRGAVVPPGGAPAPPGARLAKPCSGRRIGRRPGIARRRPPGKATASPAPPPVRPAITTPHDSAPRRTGRCLSGLHS